MTSLVAAVAALPPRSVVGISGFGGAGKSTLAGQIASDRVGVVAGDGFLIRALTDRVTDDWAGVDRARLREQVVEPFRAGRPVHYDAYDWETDSLVPQAVPACDVLVVEGVGLIHPDLSWDLSVWLDCHPEVARARALARDTAQGHDITGWAVWHLTDQQFFARFRPDLAADLVVPA